MTQVVLQLPPDSQMVGLARFLVVAAARDAGMDGERREDLRIAVSEATTNAILAHQRSGSTAPVVLCFGASEDTFEVTIADTGPGFEPDGLVEEPRDWRVEGGLGITLIRGLADEVEFVHDKGTRLHLRFSVALHNGHSQA